MKRSIVIFGLLIGITFSGFSQEEIERSRTFNDPGTNLWMGSYNTFRLSDRLFWRAEFHYRRANYEDTPFVGRMAQIYNRHAINYLVSPQFNVSLGGVLRLDFSPDPGNEAFKAVVPEPRIWHEYLFVMPFPRFQAYHRIRLEHRWSRSNLLGDDYIFRTRYRYKFYMKIPLNNPALVPGTFYLNPDVEIILQTGSEVIDSPVEDFRAYPSLAYISSPRVTYSAGLMYAAGQSLSDGSVYRQRWVLRLNAYISLDFRKQERQLPQIKLLD